MLQGCEAFMSDEDRLQRAEARLAEASYDGAMTDVKTVLENDPEHAGARLTLARIEFVLGDLAAAEMNVDRAMRAGASSVDARRLRYEILLSSGQASLAKELLADDDEFGDYERALYEARIARAEGDLGTARDKLTTILAADANHAQALLELARVEGSEGRLEDALAHARNASADLAERARAMLVVGSLEVILGRHEAARDALLEARQAARHLRIPEQLTLAAALTDVQLSLRDADGAAEAMRPLSSRAPDAALTRHFRARIAMLRQDFTAAIAESQRALRADPNHVPSQLLMAAAQLASRSLEQAEHTLDTVLGRDADNVTARKLLAQVYLQRNEPQRAQSVLEPVMGQASDAQLDWLMGRAMMRSGMTEAGVARLERSVEEQPENLRLRLELAGAYIAAQQSQRAVALLEQVDPAAPGAGGARAMLVLASVAGKPLAEARREVDRLVAAHGEDAMLLAAAGAWLGKRGFMQPARELLDRALSVDAAHVGARLTRAQFAARAGDADAARRDLEAVLEHDPGSETARIGLSELAWRAGDRASARRRLEEAISVDPRATDARMRLSQMAFLEGDTERAHGLLAQAVQVASDRGAVLMQAGQTLAQAGLAEDALARFREAVAAGAPAATLHAARLLLELDRPDEARRLVEGALVRNPNWREAGRLLVQLDAKQGRLEQALAGARSLVPDGSFASLREAEGEVFFLAGDLERSLAAFEESLQRRASGPTALKAYRVRRALGRAPVEKNLIDYLARAPEDHAVRRTLAVHYETSGEGRRAIAEYERMINAGSDDVVALNNLAWARHVAGDPGALELARRAYELAPRYAEIADTYGWILVRTGKIQDGLRVLESALAGAPENPDVLYHAAYAYVREGQTARAKELLEQSLRSERFASRRDAETLLQTMAANP
jgi:putative PEP-CTERM system TPR-repeat lipoprotein